MNVHNLPLIYNASVLAENGLFRFTLICVGDGNGNEKYVVRVDETARAIEAINDDLDYEMEGARLEVLGGGRACFKPAGAEVIEFLGNCDDLAREPDRSMTAAIFKRHFAGIEVIGHNRAHALRSRPTARRST